MENKTKHNFNFKNYYLTNSIFFVCWNLDTLYIEMRPAHSVFDLSTARISLACISFYVGLLILFHVREREKEREREREGGMDLLFHFFMHKLVASCTCPDWRPNLQPWHMGTILQPTELPSQGSIPNFKILQKLVLHLKPTCFGFRFSSFF